MNHKIRVLILLLATFGTISAKEPNYVVPGELRGQAYPAHVELTWQNPAGFTYEVYRSVDGGIEFTKQGETCTDSYLAFFGKPVEKEQNQLYRILPIGIAVNDKAAEKFEIVVPVRPSTDDDLLDMTQRYTTRYFSDYSEPQTGMARERSNNTNSDIITTGGTGFGIMTLIAGAERNYLTRENTFVILEKVVGFLEKADRFHGAWAHWYDARTGKPFSFSKFDDGGDLVETAFLVQGLLTARAWLKEGNTIEHQLGNRITQLWETVEWNWYTQEKDSLYWHWSKNYGWKMNHPIKGYDETLITYVLAASSPTYPIEQSVYENCYTKSDYYLNGKTYYDIKLDLGMEYGGPLFFTHYSFLGLNPKGLSDKYTHYFEQNRSHTLIHLAYAIDNPKKHSGFGANCWGFTSSDDPKVGYCSHHPGTDDENGTISPTAAISSIVYAPEASLKALRHFYYERGQQVFGKYGFYDAFNPGMTEGQQVVHSYLAIDQGPIAVMIENYRSGLLWRLFMSNEEIHHGLSKLGFEIDK